MTGTGSRAVRFDRYGGRDVLYIADVPMPTPAPAEVVVEVKAAGIIASVEVLFALATRYETLWECDLVRLHEDQARWHREWTLGHDGWRLSQGMIPIDPRDYVWPVASAVLPPAA